MKHFHHQMRYYAPEQHAEKAGERPEIKLLHEFSSVLNNADPKALTPDAQKTLTAVKDAIAKGTITKPDLHGIQQGLRSLQLQGKMEKWLPKLREIGLGQMAEPVHSAEVIKQFDSITAAADGVIKQERVAHLEHIGGALQHAGIETPAQAVPSQTAADIPATAQPQAAADTADKPTGILVDLGNTASDAVNAIGKNISDAFAAKAPDSTATQAPADTADQATGVGPAAVKLFNDLFSPKTPENTDTTQTPDAKPSIDSMMSDFQKESQAAIQSAQDISINGTGINQNISPLDQQNPIEQAVANAKLDLSPQQPLNPDAAKELQASKDQIKENISNKVGDVIKQIVEGFKGTLGESTYNDIIRNNRIKLSSDWIVKKVDEALKNTSITDTAALRNIAESTAMGLIRQINFGYDRLSADPKKNPNYGKDNDVAFQMHSALINKYGSTTPFGEVAAPAAPKAAPQPAPSAPADNVADKQGPTNYNADMMPPTVG